MGICLGNLNINDLARRTGYDISDEDKKILESHRDDNANIDFDSDKFHIFDLPFTISVSEKFKTQLIEILMKYENITPSNETLSITVVSESEKEKEQRLKAEQAEKERKEQNENPNSVFLIKWYLTVPVVIKNKDFYYQCFINTYFKGTRAEIPETIDGRANICIDEEGLHGSFKLDSKSEIADNANNHPEWNFVVGSSYRRKDGSYLGSHFDDGLFENVEFSIKESYELSKQFESCARTAWFDHYDETKTDTKKGEDNVSNK